MISIYDLVPTKIMALYSEPHRVYHTLEHIYSGFAVMQTFPEFQALSEAAKRTVMKAWWYHDSIYMIAFDLPAGRNERASANLAEEYGESPIVSSLVRQTIYPVTGDVGVMAGIIQDTDLFGFCTPRVVYERNNELVKDEYYQSLGDDNPRFDWAAGRTAFLKQMLERQTPFYKLMSNKERSHLAVANILEDLRTL